MRYADYYDCDICNGNAVGMSIFIQGCSIHCLGCFNPETWNFNGGKEWTPEVEEKFLNLVGRDYIKRVSFLGGSPLCDENVGDVYKVIDKIRHRYPDKQIWVYTGYTWESIYDKEEMEKLPFLETDSVYDRNQLLSKIDVLVDGQFDYNKKDLTLAFRGSSNQRIIDVQGSIKQDKVVLYTKDE